VLLAYGAVHSTSLLLVNYWKELSKYIEKRKYIVLAFVILCQAGLFFLLKLYFFEKFNQDANIFNQNPVSGENTTAPNTNNNTLLYL
jgi:homoserine trans-succinylase